jgi:phosphate-selective porin OprO/OprP
LALLCLWLAQSSLIAQEADSEIILIRNVRLVERDGQSEEAVVSILIKDAKLDVVTKDEIPAEEATRVLDAQQGVLLGKLHVGELASFAILDKDPREDIDVLLDTKTHTLFAIYKGVIQKSTLPDSTAPEPKIKKSGWRAYTPPPMALPLSYLDESKWNRWERKYTSGIFLAVVILDRQRWVSQDSANEQQVGDVREFDAGEIRGLRFGAVGTFNFKKPWVYTVIAATSAFDKGFDSDRDDDFKLFDYRLDIPVFDRINVSIGMQKEPISLDRISPGTSLPMQERAAFADALLPSRNFGVVLSGTARDQRMTWAGGAFNDWLVSSDSFGNSSGQFVGRVTWLPFLSEDESNLIHLGFGARYSSIKEGGQGLTEPEFNSAPIFVDSGPIMADNSVVYDLEASWRKGSFWLAGEYLASEIDSSSAGDPEFGGYYVTASWVLTGEMRAYGKKNGVFGAVPVAKSVYQGGWGAWELAARWSELDLTEGTIEGGEMQVASVGLNWWLSPTFNVNVNYRHIGLDRFGLNGAAHGFNARLMLILE